MTHRNHPHHGHTAGHGRGNQGGAPGSEHVLQGDRDWNRDLGLGDTFGEFSYQGQEDWSREEREHGGGHMYGNAGARHGNGGPSSDSFVGKGPKNWQRSDERIKDEVCERLCQSHTIDASDVSVDVENGTVKLEGTVCDRSTKHAIEDLVDGVVGVRDIDNRVRVERNGRMEMANAGRGTTRSDTLSE